MMKNSMDEKDLYRGKCIHNNKWVYGDLIRTDDNSRAYIGKLSVVHDDYPDSFIVDIIEVDPKTVGRYTGISYKKIKIFDGDIISVKTPMYSFIGKVIYKNGMYLIDTSAIDIQFLLGGDMLDYLDEVIGNIHDNPELVA